MALFKTKEDEEGELFKSNYIESDYAGWELKVVELTPNFFVVEASHEDYVTISRQGFDKEAVIDLVESDIAEVLNRGS
ncbi:MAG TPA: hypothetical protein VGO50_14540 [Pyrinomonadaceae bacterium]|jgi:hypothetical protein|nr:hypothetical protein [Pyrinomonadaceae bacterium]